MLAIAQHDIEDPRDIAELIDTYGWAIIASHSPDAAPVISHLPVLLDRDSAELRVLGHLARVDAEEHQLGEHPVTLIFQGPHGYISPTLYGDGGPYVGTWNFVVVHLHGTPEILDSDATWDVLQGTVDHFEADYPEPWSLDGVLDYAHSLRPLVTGFALRPERIVAKRKLSQDKPDQVVRRVIDGLSADGPYANPVLARAMRELHG